MNLAKLKKDGEQLFESLFIFENYPNNVENQVDCLLKETLEKLDYPICFFADENDHAVKIRITYAAELFNPKLMNNVIALIQFLLEQICKSPGQTVSNLKFLNPENFEQIVEEWNECDKHYPKEHTLHQLFEDTTAKYPENIALIYQNKYISYKELNEKANQFCLKTFLRIS